MIGELVEIALGVEKARIGGDHVADRVGRHRKVQIGQFLGIACLAHERGEDALLDACLADLVEADQFTRLLGQHGLLAREGGDELLRVHIRVTHRGDCRRAPACEDAVDAPGRKAEDQQREQDLGKDGFDATAEEMEHWGLTVEGFL